MDKYLKKLYQLEYVVAGRQIGMHTDADKKKQAGRSRKAEAGTRSQAMISRQANTQSGGRSRKVTGIGSSRAVTFNCTDCCDDDCRDRATVIETAKVRAIITATAITGVKAASSSSSTLKSAANGHIIGFC
ncbi:uncharacterized protein ACN2A1_005839 [Glossina fuscipes fuscipes]